MASLDDEADLYADLYGADEGEEAPQDVGGVEQAPEATKAPEPGTAELPGLSTVPTMSTSSSTPSTAAAQGPPAAAAITATATPATTQPLQARVEQPLNTQPIMTFSSESEAPKQTRFSGPPVPGYHDNTPAAFPQFNKPFDDGDQGGAPRNGFQSNVRPSEMPDEGKMFVGGLNWDTTDESLRRYFEQFGAVDACTIMRDAGGRSRGFAFLTFREPAAVNQVMVQEHYLDGKVIDPKRAIPRLEHQKTQKLFVGGLAPSVTSESMRDFFSQFGSVIDSTVMVDRESGRSKGFGFVTFEDGQGAEKLVGQGILIIDGKPIEVKLAQPRGAIKKDDGFSNNNNRGGGFGGQQGGYNNQRGGPAGMGGNQTAPSASMTPFDPQAMAQLWQKMMMQQGGMGGMGMGGMGGMPMGMGNMGMGNMGMMGMMNMNRMGMGGMGMQGMQPGMGMNGMGMGRGAGGPGMGNMGGQMGAPQGPGGMPNAGPGAVGGPPAVTAPSMSQSPPPQNPAAIKAPVGPSAGASIPNAPRGPAAMRAGGPGAQGGVGPMRQGGRGQHNYHPYSR